MNLGAAALTLLTEITHREPKLSSRRVDELYALLKEHGDEAMREAFVQAVAQGMLSVAAVRRALSAKEPASLTLPFGRAELRGGES